MEPRDYMRVILDRWAVLLTLTVIGLLGGLGYALLTPKVYSAEAKSFVSVTSDKNVSTSNIYSGSQFVFQRISSYTQLANSSEVLSPVITALGLNETVAQLSSQVTAINPPLTVILQIDVTDSSAVRAAKIVNAVAGSLGQAVQNLERGSSTGTSPISVTVVKQAVTPAVPSSPKQGLGVALGLVVGFVVGLIVAILRAQFDIRIRTSGQVRAVAGAEPLAVIRDSDALRNRSVVEGGNSAAQRADALRALRVNLALANDGVLPARIAVTSPASRDRQTSLVCNLAIAIAQTGERVCLVDTDLRMPSVGAHLGVARDQRGLTDLLVDGGPVGSALVDWRDGVMSVLVAGGADANSGALLATPAMTVLLADLNAQFDVVILNLPPVFPATDALAVLAHVNATLLVIPFAKTKPTSLADSLVVLTRARASHIGTVLVGLSATAWRRYARDFSVVNYPKSARGDQAHPQPATQATAEPGRTGSGVEFIQTARDAAAPDSSWSAADTSPAAPSDARPGRPAG